MNRPRFASSVLQAALWLSAVSAWAQATGAIDGTVFDKSGAVVPGARITVTNVSTNLVRRVDSDGAGKYTVTFIRVGVYNVLVEKQGLRPVSSRTSSCGSTPPCRSTPRWKCALPPSR